MKFHCACALICMLLVVGASAHSSYRARRASYYRLNQRFLYNFCLGRCVPTTQRVCDQKQFVASAGQTFATVARRRQMVHNPRGDISKTACHRSCQYDRRCHGYEYDLAASHTGSVELWQDIQNRRTRLTGGRHRRDGPGMFAGPDSRQRCVKILSQSLLSQNTSVAAGRCLVQRKVKCITKNFPLLQWCRGVVDYRPTTTAAPIVPTTAAPPTCVDTFFSYPGVSLAGLTPRAGVTTEAGCQAACLAVAMAQCSSYQFAGGSCFFLSDGVTNGAQVACSNDPTVTLQRRVDCDLGVLQPLDTPTPAWTLYADLSILGGSLISVGLNPTSGRYCCALQCQMTATCCGVDYNESFQACFFHTVETINAAAECSTSALAATKVFQPGDVSHLSNPLGPCGADFGCVPGFPDDFLA